MTLKETPAPARHGNRSLFDRAINDDDRSILVRNPGKFFEVVNPNREDEKWSRKEVILFRASASRLGFAVRSVGCTDKGSVGRVWIAYDPHKTQTEK